jgi:methylthioribose-1-phosphate isomerase
VFTSAADSIAMDGHIANKIGTCQLAILANHFDIPYFVTGIPDRDRSYGKDIPIEEREGEAILSFGETRHTLPGVQGIYPSFDITPPRLISGVVTDKGVFSPYDLHRYFEGETKQYY